MNDYGRSLIVDGVLEAMVWALLALCVFVFVRVLRWSWRGLRLRRRPVEQSTWAERFLVTSDDDDSD